ncbi:unnamed protein product [Calicophoron daubneyi]|uniref:BRCT domain-containing protein n=1 Tax=Calicophoron daubneyi TaxID=300641 RepID=A0AAV2T5P8_CALDB
MDSNDLFAQSEADVHTEDLSSIIPSSELDPPPPVTYVVPPCKPGDLCIADTETLDTHEASDSIDDGLDAEAMKKHRHMFSQADDFQDSSERCGRFLGDIEHSDNSPNTTEEGTWSRNVLTETPFPIVKLNPVDSASCVEQQQSSVLSPSELPHMTPAEKVNMIGPQVRVSSSVVRHRESTPVHLDRVPVNLRQPTLDAGNQSFSPSFSVPKRALTRASEPAPTTVKSLGVGDSPSAEGPNDSWPKSNQDSDSVRNSSPAAAENSWNSNANSCDTKNIVEDTESERSGTRNSPNEPTQELSVHLSVLSSSAGSNARANPKAVFMSGFTVEVASLYASATVDLLQNRCIALVHQLIGYICGARSDVSTPYNSSQHSACEPSSSTSGPSLNSKLNEHLTAPSKMTAKPMVAKPLFQANFRGSSSSNSDLFSPRPKKAYTATNAVESSGIGSLTSLSGSLLRTLPNAKCLPPPAVRSSSSSSGTFYPRGQKLLGITRSSTSSSDPSTSPKSSAATHGLQPLTDQDSTVRPTGASAKAADNNELPSSEMEVPRQFTNVPDSCAESQKAITFQPSLALVLETPLEYNEENRSKCLPHPDSSSTVTPVDLKVTKCSPAEVRTKSPNTIELDSNGRLLVYGRWHTEQYYYAGAMSVTKPNFRRLVQFEDGSRARLKPSDILAVHLLPVNTEVFVDWDDTSEYTGDCIVEGHLTDPKLPYLILSRVTKERKALSRRQVSVHHSQVCHLRRMGQLSSETLDVILKRITQSERDSKCLPAVDEDRPLLLASPDISLANVLFGKRQAKTKRFRSSWVTPTNRAMSDDEDSQTHESGASRVRHQSVPQTHPKCETPPKRVLDKSDEDICPKKQCLEESNGGDISPDQVTSKSVDEKSDDLTTPRRSKSTSRPSSARGSLFPASPTSLSFLISICRSLSVPTPSTTLFSGWTIILTGGPRSLADASGSSSRPMNRGHFEQLILLCGGRVGSEITPAIIGRPQPSGSPVMGEDQNPDEDTNHSEQHIALVAPDVCRTLKYFQALATLGQVPLLSTDWILDSCREEASSVVDENHEPGTDQHANWPLQLLLNYPGRYELPRGLVTETRKLISWCAVPVRYRSPAYRSLPALSLFDLQANWLDDKQHKFQLIAIVTDDQNVFAPAWSNILQLAGGASVHFDSERVGSQTATQTILVLSTKEAPRHLNNLAKSKTYWSKHETSFVLVDKSGLRHRTLTSLKNSPFQLVTCDYFIQSLICGHLLNPNSSSAFIPA